MNSKEADIQEEVKFTAQHKSSPAVVFVRTIFFFYIKILKYFHKYLKKN